MITCGPVPKPSFPSLSFRSVIIVAFRSAKVGRLQASSLCYGTFGHVFDPFPYQYNRLIVDDRSTEFRHQGSWVCRLQTVQQYRLIRLAGYDAIAPPASPLARRDRSLENAKLVAIGDIDVEVQARIAGRALWVVAVRAVDFQPSAGPFL